MSTAGTYHEEALKFGGNLLRAQSGTSVSSIDFVGSPFGTTTYNTYVFSLDDVAPSINTSHLQMSISADGSTWTSTGWWWAVGESYSGVAGVYWASIQGGTQNAMYILGAEYTPLGVSGSITIFNNIPADLQAKNFIWHLAGYNSANGQSASFGGGLNASNGNIRAVRFSFHQGLILNGVIRLYGLTK